MWEREKPVVSSQKSEVRSQNLGNKNQKNQKAKNQKPKTKNHFLQLPYLCKIDYSPAFSIVRLLL